MATKKNNKWSWKATDEEKYEAQQAFLNATSAESLQTQVADARDRAQSYASEGFRTSKWSDRRIAMKNYHDSLQKYQTYLQLSGNIDPTQKTNLERMYDQYNRSWDDLNRKMQTSQMGFGGIGMQTAAGILPNGSEITGHDAMGQRLMPGRGLIDTETGMPTESNQRAAQKNYTKSYFQQEQERTGQEAARWGQQAESAQSDKELADKWLDAIANLPVTNDARVSASNDAWMRQAAQELGIESYIDRDDLLRKIRVKSQTAGASGKAATTQFNDYMGQYRGYVGAEYQLDNPEESITANYYKAMRDEAAENIGKRSGLQDWTLGNGALSDYVRYNSQYADQLYADTKNETILEIRSNPTAGPIYQQAMEASQNVGSVVTLRTAAHSEIQDLGGISAQTEADIRALAEQYGITVGQGDAALEAALEQMHQQQSHTVNTNMARLQAQGYDPEKLRQYIQQALNEERMDEKNAEAREYAAEHPGAASVGSSFTNVLSGGAYIATAPQAIGNAIAGVTGNYDKYQPIDTNSAAFDQTQYVMNVRDEVVKNIEANGGDSFWYSTGMSMLDNLVQMAVGTVAIGGGAIAGASGKGAGAMLQAGVAASSPATLATMGLGAASQELVSLTEQGVSSDQAYLQATLAGGIEIITEKIGIDSLVSNLGRRQASQLLRAMAQQMAAEGGEEALAEVMNLAADYVIRLDDSEIMQMLDESRRMGMTEEEAKQYVRSQLTKQVAEAAAAGALSGAGFGAGAVAANAASNTEGARGRQILQQGTLPQLQQQAAFYGVDASGLSEESTAREIGTVHRQVEQEAQKAEEALLQFAREKKYDADSTDALRHAYAGYSGTGAGNMSAREFAISFDTAYQHGRSDAQYGAGESYLQRAAEDGLTAGLTPGTIAYAYHSGREAVDKTAKAKTKAVMQDAAQKKKAAQTAQTAKAANVMQVEQISEHEAVLVMPDGSKQNITQMDTRDTAAQIVAEAMDDGYGTVVVNQMLRSYDGNMNPGNYYEQFRTAMLAGIEGESLGQAKKAAAQLPATVAKAAYDRGRLLGKAYDLADRIGSAGEQALELYDYAAPAEFEKFYKAGLAGMSFRQAEQELGAVSKEIKDEMQAAVNAGLRDNKGGFVYGEQSDGNGQQRQADVDSDQRTAGVSAVAEDDGSAAEAEAGQAAESADGRSAEGTQRVSARDLGLEDGTDRATARIIAPERLTKKQKAKVQEYADAGIELVLIEGYLEIRKVEGTTVARGAQLGDKVIATVSDSSATWEQIARHEAKHRYFRQHPDALRQEWKQIAKTQSEEDLRRWLAAYAETYRDIADSVDIDYLIEEALCDLAADIDYTEATPAGYEALDAALENGQKNTAREGGRLSLASYRKAVDDIVYSDDNKPFDHRIVLFGSTPQNLIKLGFEQLPMMITSKHIYTMAKKNGRFQSSNDHYHNLGAERVKLLPDAIKEPIVTYTQKDKPKRITIITQMKDETGNPIMVAVEFSARTDYNEINIFTNFVTTGYGRKETAILTEISEALADNRVLQSDKKRSQESPSDLWARCPEGLWSSDFTDNIQRFKDSVKRFRPKEKQIRKANNEVKLSAAGRNAATADLEALEQAEQMEQDGGSAGEIYRETGWYRGADGQWRFEIDDSTMRYYRAGDAQFRKDHPGYVRYQELMEKFLNGNITETEAKEMRDSVWKNEYNRLKERVDRGNAYLPDILEHDALFEAYPQLREVKIEFVPMAPGRKGAYNRRTNTITLAEALRNEPEGTLVHEIQHAIQTLEGFASGSSRQYWERIIETDGRIDSKRLRDAQAVVTQFESNPANAAIIEARNRLNEIWDSEGVRAGNAYYAQLEAEGLAGKVDGYEDMLWELSSARVAYRNEFPSALYENTAGEQEARDVTARRTMTAEQRRQQMPQTGNKDTVFVEGSMAAYAEEQSSIKEQLRDNLDRLNEMQPVANVMWSGNVGSKPGALRKWIIEKLRPTGFKVDRQGFGEIIFDEKRLNTSLDYLTNDAEAAAYQAIPRVLKRGVEISQHSKHKNRTYDTVTFAAPITINGKRGNMAVVVKKTKQNYYKMHRILTPDGKMLALDQKNNDAEPTPGGGVIKNDVLYTPISSASKLSITADVDAVKGENDTEQQLKDANKRIKQLEGINNYLREQMRVTPDYTPDARDIRKAAKLFMAEYGGSWSQQELEGKLQQLWKTAQQKNKNEVSFDKLMAQTRLLAAELVQNYLDKGNQDAETLREIKQYLRSTKIYLSQDLRSDLDHYGGYAAVRKANFGKIRLANQGMGVDQAYQELSELYPGYFPDSIWNPADQLMHMIDVIADGTQVLQRSPLDGMPDAMDYMTNKILWELGLVKAAPQTKADKILEEAGKRSNRDYILQAAGAHEQEQMEQLESYYKGVLQKTKADREDRIQKLKDDYRKKAQEERDWKAELETKRKLLYHANKLKRMSRKVGPEQQKQIEEIFGDINTMCQRMTGYTVVRDHIQGMSTEGMDAVAYKDLENPRRKMSTEEAEVWPIMAGDKYVDTGDLKKWYDDQKKNNPDFIPDKRIEEILANWNAKQINMMSVQEAQALLDVALNIENEIRTQKQLIDAQDRREVYQQVSDVIANIQSTKGKYDKLLSRGFTGWITESTLSPVRMVQRMTGYHDNDPMYQATIALQQGEMKMLDYQRRAYEMFKPFTDDKQFMDYLAGKGHKQQPITIGGMDERGNIIEVKITPDMRVALYLHSQNYQNLRHIQRGGLTVPHYESYVKGKMEAAYDQAQRLRLTPSQVRQITSHMTQREIAYAQRLERYFNVMSKAEINETALKLKGYEIAKTNHYYPIETNRDFVVKEFDSLKFDGSLENMGFTKERIEGGNPILLGNASTTLARSVKQHSMYTGLAVPLRNFNKLRGVSIVQSDDAGAVKYQADSLMDTLRRKWGKSGLDYVEKMVADLSGVKPQQDRGMEVLNKLRSNYAGAVLELNPSTAMKQLIAYPSAASVLGWDAMTVGLSKWERVNIEEVNRYTPLLWHRMQGYIDSDLGDYVANKKHKPRGLNWNQGVDVAVVKRIWKAAEWKVAHEDRSLVSDRDAWMKATAELFNQVMLQSQANYTTMQRGQILRTDNVFLRSIAMFKTEPFQSFNVLYDAFANEAAKRRQLQAARQEAERGDDETAAARVEELERAHDAAKKRIGQAVPAVLTSNLLEALITFAWAFFRGKDDDWEDDEAGEITAASFFKRLGMRTLANLGGIVPFGAELAEAVTAVVMGDQYYGIENMETSVIADALSDCVALTNTIKGWLAKPEEGEEKHLEVYDIVLELLDQGLKLGAFLGVPTENVAKTLKGITRWTLIAAMGETEGEYWYRRFTSQTDSSGHAKEDLDSLYQTLEEGDMEAYSRLLESILRYKDADSIESGLNTRTKQAAMSGRINQEQAIDILQKFMPDADPADLYWKVQGWGYMSQTGEDSFSKYDYVYDAMYDGVGFDAAYQQLIEHGVTEDAAMTQIRSQIREWYQGASTDGLTITEDEAKQMLQQYGGKTAEEADALILKWKCLTDTGVAYDDIKQSVLDGTITETEAAQMLQQYGGKSAEEAASAAAAYSFVRQHPELAEAYDGDFIQTVAEKYTAHGAGIDVNVFVDVIQYAKGTSAKKDEISNYIAAIPGLTSNQRDSLMKAAWRNYDEIWGVPWK